MAKTIKFNLILDNKPVRTIEELQENFCIDDIQEFYENGLLQKWLKVRGYDEYLKKVDEIKDNKNAIIELIKIFEIETSKDRIEEGIYSLKFKEEKKQRLEELNDKNYKREDVVNAYHDGYEKIKNDLIEHKGNMKFIKNAVKTIYSDYFRLLKIDFVSFFETMEQESPLTLFAMMMLDGYRNSGLFDDKYKSKLLNLRPQNVLKYDYDTNMGWRKITDKPARIIQLHDCSKYVGIRESEGTQEFAGNSCNVKKQKFEHGFEYRSNSSSDYVVYVEDVSGESAFEMFCGETENGYWKDLEKIDTKVMVIFIPSGTKIASPEDLRTEYNNEEVNGKFLILDGLCYKSNTDSESIIYLEV